MRLSIGDTLGPYKIVALVGVGGMGEVYRAVDTRLDRPVAIKISSREFDDRFEPGNGNTSLRMRAAQ
jgi:serine/threonine protein kinase